VVDATGTTVDNEAELMAASARLSWPLARGYLAVSVQDLMATDKFALRAMTCSLAQELAPFGITVNDVCPGPVDSAMLRSMGAGAVEEGRYDSVEEYLASVGQDLPTRRLVLPSEVASAVSYLASPESSACTGQAIRVDGGLLN
jgi:NAD(P)-dependent dehydrogenase (short-subunit alcohol dehydrogenase family)